MISAAAARCGIACRRVDFGRTRRTPAIVRAISASRLQSGCGRRARVDADRRRRSGAYAPRSGLARAAQTGGFPRRLRRGRGGRHPLRRRGRRRVRAGRRSAIRAGPSHRFARLMAQLVCAHLSVRVHARQFHRRFARLLRVQADPCARRCARARTRRDHLSGTAGLARLRGCASSAIKSRMRSFAGYRQR